MGRTIIKQLGWLPHVKTKDMLGETPTSSRSLPCLQLEQIGEESLRAMVGCLVR